MPARADVYDIGPPAGDRGEYLLPPLCQPTRDLGSPKVVLELPGPPKGKGRPRTRVVPGQGGRPAFATIYTDAETKSYEAMVRYAGEQAMAGRHLIEGALRVHVYSVFPIPASWPRKRQAAADEGYIRPTGKPDVDNIIKAGFDSLNGIVWRDDAQIVWEITGAML
jgi:Holliday junction resolvase RusA-like endonuclease